MMTRSQPAVGAFRNVDCGGLTNAKKLKIVKNWRSEAGNALMSFPSSRQTQRNMHCGTANNRFSHFGSDGLCTSMCFSDAT